MKQNAYGNIALFALTLMSSPISIRIHDRREAKISMETYLEAQKAAFCGDKENIYICLSRPEPSG